MTDARDFEQLQKLGAKRSTPCPNCRVGRLQRVQVDGRLVMVACTRCGYTKSVGGAR